jgi:hypothetical protein
MGSYAGTMRNAASGSTIQVYDGFSWPCFFFGPLWYAAKGMIGMFFVGFVLALVSFGLSWLVLPFFANGQYRDHLSGRGYQIGSAGPRADPKVEAGV